LELISEYTFGACQQSNKPAMVKRCLSPQCTVSSSLTFLSATDSSFMLMFFTSGLRDDASFPWDFSSSWLEVSSSLIFTFASFLK